MVLLASVLVTITSDGGQAAAARTPGELVKYQFGEGSGATVTDSGSGAPLNLTIANPGNVTWLPGGGLSIDSSTMISSSGGAAKVSNAIKASGAFTVEAWIEPGPGIQEGPARIVSNSPNNKKRNFMLGQGAYGNRPDDTYTARTRTTSSTKGEPLLLTTAGTAVPETLTHVVLTRDAAGNRLIYVDGNLQASDVLGGTTANWDSSFPLVLGNEGSGGRPWIGTFCLAAIYDSALSPAQVADNYAAGCGQANTDPELDPVGDQSNDEGDTVNLAVTGSDVDGDTLTFSASNLPPALSIDANTGVVSGTISQTAANGSPYSVDVSIDDGNGGTDSETISWTVNAINVSPVLDPVGDQDSAEGQTISLPVTASDADGDTLTFSATGLPPSLSIDANTGVISGVLDPGTNTYNVDITVDDGNGGTDSEAITWSVTGNTDPELDPVGDQSNDEGDTVNLAVTASDVDGDTLTFSATGLPPSLSIDANTGVVSGTISQTAANGSPYSVDVSIDDGKGGTDSETISWTVNAINVSPVLDPVGDQNSAEGQTISLPVTANDDDGDTLTFSATGLPPSLSIDANTGVISGVVDPGTNTYNVDITVDDGNGGSDSESIVWQVSGNTDPVLDPIADQSNDEGDTVNLSLSADDPDGDTLTFSATGLPPSLSIDANTGVISGTIDAGAAANSPYSVDVTIDDGNGGSDSQSFSWTVDVPVVSDAIVRYQFNEGSGTTVADSGSGPGLPLDLAIQDPGNVTWVPGGGLTIDSPTAILSPDSLKLVNAAEASGEFTVEAWIRPAAGDQDGPARIISNGPSSKNRNFLVGQGAWSSFPDDTFAFRSRTTSSNKGEPTLFSPSGTAVPLALTHVVMSRDAAGVRTIYVNGQPTVNDTLGGTLDNWDPSFPLVLGNVANGSRAWLGTYCEVSIYDSALTAAEVADNFGQGCDIPGPAPEALVQITPNGAIGATTFGNSTISVTNTGEAGAPSIVDVSFDLRGSLIPDATFDPIGTAGDEGTQCLSVSAEGGTGFVTPGDPCVDPFSLPHEDSPGVAGNGWDGMTLDFNGFDVGETIVFGVDVDPTTIQGVPGAGGAGAISGLELSGSTVTVTFSDGSSETSNLFGDGSAGGGQAVVGSATGQVAPTGIEMIGVSTSPTVFPNNSEAGNVAAVGDQTVRVSGPDGASVTLLAVTADLQSPAPFDEDPFESDAATAVAYQTGTISGGFVDFTVSLPDDTMLYHYVATIDDGAAGATSGQLVIGIGDTDTPVLDPIADVSVSEGDTVAVAINSTDPNGDTITLGLTSNPDIEALGAVLTDNGDGTGSIDWVTEAGDAGTYTVDVTATDGTNTATESFTITVVEPDAAQALIQITPGGGIGATTFGNSTITISNAGDPGAPAIDSVLFDVRGSLIPDATFDPIGTAGDEGTQCLAVSAEGGTGFIAPGDPCTDPFSLPHEDSPGVAGNGWDGMTLDFNDFSSGEAIVFGVDVDPTTIQGVPGAGGAGAVSGLELSGSTVTVTFSNGQVLTGSLFGDGSDGGGEVLVSSALGQVAPTAIEMVGVTTSPTVFPNNSEAGNVAATGDQTVRVSGPDGATVELLAVTGELQSPTPFDPDPFESDAATVVAYQTGTISGGFVDFTVSQPSDTVRYHYVATIDDGANGPTSAQLVIEIGDTDTPVLDPIADVSVSEGDTVAVVINSTDPNGDAITLDISSTPDIEALGAVLTDNGDGTGSIDWVTEAGDAGTYDVDVTATDGTNTATQSFTINVLDPNAVVLHRVNSGGPEVASTDGGGPWLEDQSAAGANIGGTAAAGVPSQYLIAGGENAYGTAATIDLSDPSVPAGTPEALFQTEHWDPDTGSEMTYEFPVGSGQAYQVDLYFAEIFATANDVREFAVSIEGTQVLTNFDIHELVGANAGLVETFVSPIIADDFLTITFTHQVENPKVNAIEIRTAGPPPVDVPPTVTAIGDQSVQIGNSLPVDITTTEPDGDPVTITSASTPDASAFTTFVDDGDGTGSLTFAPTAGDDGVYTIDVTATDKDGSDTESFTLTVTDVPVGGTVYARINSGGPLVTAIDGGPDWDADTTAANHPFLTNAGSDGNAGFPAVEPGATVPATVPGAIFDTERWSTSVFTYGVPVPAGTQATVRLFLGNGFSGTAQPGERVFDIAIDGTTVEDDFDMIPAFGNEVGGMLEYLVTSDGTIDITFTQDVVQNPLINGLEVVSATSAPGQLGAPASVNFGTTLINGSATDTVTLSNLGFEVGDPDISVTSVTAAGGEFATNFSGPVTIGPAGSTTFDVTFSPTSAGAQSGTLTVTHDGANSPLTITLDGNGSSSIPVSFTSTGLSGESSNNPTSLDFGPDSRLYVAQQDATIKAYTVVRNSATDYDVTATETINIIKSDTTNHNDDGSTITSTSRQMTGLLATGTAANPVLYVTSSDSRISVGNDTGLDTNSGVVTRLTWNGTSWDKVDIVRGLPRSEENHSTNGLALDEGTNTLYVIQGGHANKGAPGNNFSGTPEYYLSAALLTVDLDAIDALGTFIDARDGSEVAYDLRTLDDPTRANITNASPNFPYPSGHPLFNSEVDLGDPFGGNNGLNQAIPEPNGPVQIYSPGYRNAFDVVFTSDGRLYTSDNGPNTGWGGQPLVYAFDGTPKGTGPFDQGAGDYCTNEFNESASNSHGDPLHFINGPGYYGGHPTPIRAFPELSRVIVYVNSGGWTEAGNYNFYDLLPPDLSSADFPDNPIECEYSSNDPGKYIDIINASTNGITEYTASNFGGALQGNIMTASFDGNIYSYELNAAGDASVDKQALFSGFGSQPLDVIAQGDGDPFPGTVWAATYGADNITVFEPSDSTTCTGADDINLDEDNDGYSNADEIDNGTDPCSGGDKPTDNDGDNLSDLNDPDDDNDGIPDVDDEFAVDADNGLTTSIPVLRPFLNSDPGTDLFGLGLTGLMTNGTTDYLDQFDPDVLNAGGNGGQFGIEVVTAGDAYQAGNNQDNGFQYGVNADTTTDPFVVSSSVLPPLFDGLTPVNFQAAGIFLGTGDQDNYLKIVVNANGGAGGIQVLKEEAGTATFSSQFNAAQIGGDVLTATSSIELYLVVDPGALTVQPQVSIDGGTITSLGSPVSIPASWLDGADANGLAVGIISTSFGAGPEFAASWDYLDVTFAAAGNSPPTVDTIADQTVAEGGLFTLQVIASDVDAGDTLGYALSGDVPAGMTIDAGGLIDFAPDLDDSGSYAITVEVDDGNNPAVTEDFTLGVTQTDSGTVLSRINAGGPAVTATDGGPDWTANPNPNTLPELVAGGDNVFLSSSGSGVPVTDISDPSVPASTPIDVFQSERWDPAAAPEMAWNFPVSAGAEIEVRIGHAEIYNGVTAPGARVYSILIDGVEVETNLDPFGTVGAAAGFVTDYVVTADGDGLDIEFIHVTDNPNPKSFEIIELVPAGNASPTVDPIDDQTGAETNAFSYQVVAADTDVGDTLSYALSGEVPAGMTIDASGLIEYTPDLTGSGSYDITVEVDDGTNPAVNEDFVLDVSQTAPGGNALFRVNPGGPELAALDGSFPDWESDNSIDPSQYGTVPRGTIFAPGATPVPDLTDPTVPGTAPADVYRSERYGQPMLYSFPVAAGTEVELRVHVNETFQTTAGSRLFDIEIDGVTVASDVDLFAEFGKDVAGVLDFLVVSDGSVDLTFTNVADNASVKGIEIIGVGGVPSIELLGSLDGSTITTDTLTVEWLFNGYDEPGEHAHFTIDGGPATDPGNAGTVNPGGTHNTIFRPVTSIDLVDLGAGPHTVAVQVADNGHVGYTNPEATATATFTVDLGPALQDDPVVDHYIVGDALFRVNAGGPAVTALDGGIDWEVDDDAGNPISYLGGGPTNISTTGAAVTLDPSVPASTPSSVFGAERWDPAPGAEMAWNFPVTDGTPTLVRLYFADFNGPTQVVGGRVFDVSIDGDLVLDDYDIFADVGANTGGMKEFYVVADADGIDIDFQREVENPEIRAIEIVELVDAVTGFGDVDFLTVVSNPGTNTEDLDITTVEQTLDGPGGTAGTPASIAGDCVPGIPATVAPGDSVECRFSLNVTGADADLFQDTVNVVGAFTGGQAVDVDSNTVDITIAAPAPITTRLNAGGALVAATDAGPDWAADPGAQGGSLLTVPSGSTTGGFSIGGYDGSVPAYGQIDDLFLAERYDPTDGTPPDVMTYEIPVSLPGASATVNLFMMNGWSGTSAAGARQFNVLVEGVQVLTDFDLSNTYGHQTAGLETFSVTDDGDGVITIVFDHGAMENPLVNAIEVIG